MTLHSHPRTGPVAAGIARRIGVARWAVAALLLVPVAAGRADGDQIDQSNLVAPSQNCNTSSSSNLPIGQEFTPSLAGLDFVDLRVVDFGSDTGPGTDFHLQIRQGSILGTVVGTSETVFVPDNTNLGGGDIITRFLFPSVVALTPGSLYVIDVLQQAPSSGTGNFGITAGALGGTYAGGSALVGGSAINRDFIFAEGLTTAAVPEPAAAAMLGLGLLGVAAVSARRAARDRGRVA